MAAGGLPETSVAPPVAVPIDAETARLHLKISHAFKIFDQDNSNQVDVRLVEFCVVL